jgi:CPA1 family monovalent cation:H+ antiporter
MEAHVQTVTMLLLVAVVVALLTRRLRLPYSVGLVAAGIALAAVPHAPRVVLTQDLLFYALLPPLLFEAAFHIPWEEMRRNFPLIAVLTTLGVMLSAGLTAAGMHYLVHWQWIAALAFGVLIAATDPVSVIATFKEAGSRGRLRLLIESESLLNDGTAAVAFSIVVAIASGRQFGAAQIAVRLLATVGGGILCGGFVAALALLLAGRTTDHLVETAMTTIAAYGSFLLAGHFGFSGVLATITAGLFVRNSPWTNTISLRGREVIQTFWEYAAFIANSFIFLLIGMHEASQNLLAVWLPAVAAIALVTLGRAASIYPCCLLFARSSLRVCAKHQHILVWGGLRGALALALALSLSDDLPLRDSVIGVSFAVVAFSIFVQGLTIPPLLRRMGEIPGAHREK